MLKATVKSILMGMLFVLFLFSGCAKHESEPPWINIAGYRAELDYDEQFTKDISNWHLEGDGEAGLTDNGGLKLLAYKGGNGLVLWAPIVLSENFQLEYEVNISDSCGTNAIFFCAQDMSGEDLLKSTRSRTGKLNDYINSTLRNYMITYHTLNPEGNEKNQSRLRKNPQYLLLSHADSDPCLRGNRHQIDIVKMSNRIQFYVNGILIHDVRDKGGFDAPVYMEGRLGFRIEPIDTDASVLIHRVKLYQLNPS